MASPEPQARRLLYYLSAEASLACRQQGAEALQIQQRLWETYQRLGITDTVDLVHPTGAVAYTLAPEGLVAAQQPTAPRAPAQDARLAPGTIEATEVVTAYRMSAEESALWAQGDGVTRAVERTIADRLEEAQAPRAVPVLLQDGRHAYTTGGERPLQTLLGAMSEVRERLLALREALHHQIDITVTIHPQRQQGQGMGL
jgi:hypothetical protein